MLRRNLRSQARASSHPINHDGIRRDVAGVGQVGPCRLGVFGHAPFPRNGPGALPESPVVEGEDVDAERMQHGEVVDGI
jgi:hypothetical protein